MKKLCFLFCFLIAGCAAKPPGGGHVVGNPLAPEHVAADCGCGSKEDCQCNKSKMEKKKEKGCGCSGH
jgi:hypothetical protein